jgi:hypothetical protein
MEIPEAVDSPIPAALRRRPRGVRRKPGTLGPLLLGRILSAPILIISMGLIGYAMVDPIVAFVVAREPAHITRLWTVFEGHLGMSDHVEYRLDRSGFVGREEVLPAEYDALRAGQAVDVHAIHLGSTGYSLLDRSWGAYARSRKLLWFAAAFGLAIGGVLFHAIWWMPARIRRLARTGKATFGAIVEKTIVHGNRRYFYFMLTYQFKADGILQARRIRISPQRYESADIKDLVIILFDPKRPGRNIVYDYCDFVAN